MEGFSFSILGVSPLISKLELCMWDQVASSSLKLLLRSLC